MIRTFFAAGASTVAVAGAVIAGATAGVPAAPAAQQVRPVVFDAPLPQAPQEPQDELPTAGQLAGVLNGLADPGVPFTDKAGLVEGGVGPAEASMADGHLQNAANKGELPLSFKLANIQSSGPGAATADVTVSGPKMAPQTMNIGFVNQDGWKLARTSVEPLLQVVSGT